MSAKHELLFLAPSRPGGVWRLRRLVRPWADRLEVRQSIPVGRPDFVHIRHFWCKIWCKRRRCRLKVIVLQRLAIGYPLTGIQKVVGLNLQLRFLKLSPVLCGAERNSLLVEERQNTVTHRFKR